MLLPLSRRRAIQTMKYSKHIVVWLALITLIKIHVSSETPHKAALVWDYERTTKSVVSTTTTTTTRQTTTPWAGEEAPELIPWQLFNSRSLWDIGHQSPQQTLSGPLLYDVRSAVDAAIARLNQGLSTPVSHENRKPYTRADLLDGRHRYLPGLGSEYVINFVGRGSARTETVRLKRPVGQLMSTKSKSGSGEVIRLVVPYYHEPKTFGAFLANLAHLILEKNEPLELLLIFYWRGSPAAEASEVLRDRKRVGAALDKLNHHAGRTVARLVDEKRLFSRGHALLRGAEQPGANGGDVLLFFCDVDMFISTDTLRRCRTNAIPGKSVYYPIVFSTYNPSLRAMAWDKPLESPWKYHPVTRDVGFWRDFGYGMTCQYRSDFRRAAGKYLISNTWGGEDVHLFKHHRRTGIEVVRAPDPGLVHVHHRARCDISLTPGGAGWCGGSQLLTEASSGTWARWVHKMQQGRMSLVVPEE
ncbi:chondroitin sulfate N-acetylgalactosaminyltransferase 1-like isoform X1 [Amphibalanus amphitrite]|uniref:chondroitin sulfate N-acetylgalactosaminyltransferase 1-like isoform X1 n=2 Tax=Amphibalanus amphitrite TaxID=1232801 RepID=UPI001C9089C5|nr:chondroitin sulfate N-acetylgalactosaminyltransferase 1-like isoform X1 [Amphibalanus amphitrite]